MRCPAHGLAVQTHESGAGSGRPQSRFYRIQHRIADRFGPEVAAAFVAAVEQVRGQIDLSAVEQAIRTGDIAKVESALGASRLRNALSLGSGLQDKLSMTYGVTGRAAGDVLSDALGLAFSFDARDPNAIIYARSETAKLVRQVTADQRLAIQGIMGRAFTEGIPPRRAARLIHEVVGIRPSHAQAPMNLAQEIRDGHAAAATSRRLDAVSKAKIRSRINRGTVTDEFVDEMQKRYRQSLIRRRAEDIARTETIDAANAGTQQSWQQAQRKGVLPQTARRFAVVTPDDRLRATHAQVPFMNPEGVRVGEPFDTPFGALMYPPWETNCRCGVALVPNPSEGGIL